MLARLFVIVGGLLVLVLLAALAAPPFIDWTGYRADFEREASAILGRKVTVRGEARARLLPFPSVTFTDVAVSGGAEGQPSMTVDTFSMDAELAPFLRGEVLIFDMRLERPRAVIGVSEDGKVDWAMRPSSPFDAAQIAIEKLTITDGEVELQHGVGGRTHSLTNINAAVSAKSLLGPWRVDGSMLFDGEYSDISASTGRVAADGQMRVRLRVRTDSYAATAESDGNASIEQGVLKYAGQFKLAEDLADAMELRGGDGETVALAPARAAPGYRASGKFQFDHRRLVLDEFRFETGPLDNPYAADGSAFLDLGQEPRFRIEASGAQVQFDEAVSGERGPVLGAAARITALQQALRRLPRPTIPGSVDVKLPAVVAGDTTIRDVHLTAEPARDGWLVHSLGATLPGRATLEAGGLLNTGDAFGFRGKMLLAVAQPSGFAAWLAKDVDEAVRRLPAAGFSAEVDLTAGRQRFSDLELVLGGAKFTGRIEAAQEGDARPSVMLALDGGALDLEGLSAFASIFVSSEGANRFTGQDLDLDIKAGPVQAWGLSADQVDTALRLRGGVLEIDRLSLTGLAGASVSATGRISDFPENPAGRLDASLVAVDLAPLVGALESQYGTNAVIAGLGQRVQAYPGLLEDARIDWVMSVAAGDGGDGGFAISAQGGAGGSAFSASLSGQRNGDDLLRSSLSATLGIRNDDATVLMALAGLPALPLGLTGPGTADISARGDLHDGMETHALLTGDDFRASFEGTVSAVDGAAVKGKAGLEAADIEPWLMTAGAVLPGMGAGTSISLATDADYGGGLLILNGLSGAVNEAAFSGDINVEVKEGRPHITGELALDELDLAPMAAMLMGDAAFAPVAEGWPTAPFAAVSTAPFNAELDISTAALLAGHLATAYDASLALKLDGEGLRVSGLKGKLFDGALSGLFELKNSAGTGLLNAQMSLSGADLAAMLPEAGLSGRTDFSTSVSTTGKSVDGMVTSLSGSGTASLKELHIANLNEDALPAFLHAADAAGRDIDARRTAEFAPGIAAQGDFAAQDAAIAFTIANGVVRAPPVKLAGKAADISADLTADLASSNVHVQGAIAYRPGEDALVGSEPVLNFAIEGEAPAGDMQRSFDSAPLAQYLTQRALEHEQQRVEAMQAELLEKQRLRREARYYADLQVQRERAAEEERRRQEEARLKAEEEARAKAEAERAAREEQERLRREAEAARTRAQPAIERMPPPATNDNGPATEPFTLQNLLKSLEGG
ncbi:AsmA family protein [Aquamicrobium ahrensii]|uniref:Uncharacterized protein involved in outer membrane biogenesis n=1 Tax=Aquamicrobium ahrensii TaxID=469551 RepID=A0ABV2KL38_9HYPH